MKPAEQDNSQQKRLHEEYEKRLARLQRCKHDVSLQAIVLEMCRRDVLYFINDWVWTFDPRRKPAMLPFLLFQKQQDYILWRQERRSKGENGLIEKSRDMGLTWLNICSQVHCWLFEENYKGAFGSRKEDLVDRIGDPDSVFEKLRILLRHLPKWMLPKDFSWSEHDNFLKLVNPNNGSIITGEAGDSIGRGGRSAVYDWDEVAFTPRPHKVDAALSNNTDCVFYTSSVNGRNFFWKKRMTYPHEWVFRFHWREDPRKDDRWYQQMCVKYDPVIVASEVDLDYGASEEGIYIPSKYVEAAINLKLPTSGKLQAAMDISTTGNNRTVLGFRQGPVVLCIEDWQGLDPVQSAFKARERVVTEGAYHLAVDADGVGAGTVGALASIPDLEFEVSSLRSAGSPSERTWAGENKTSKEKFHNARAEFWGLIFERFRKTYHHINGIESYPLDELISIPNNPTLIAQISQPKRKFTSTGKILVESKQDMQNRGVDSPDHADMLVYLFSPEQENELEARGRVAADRIKALVQ